MRLAAFDAKDMSSFRQAAVFRGSFSRCLFFFSAWAKEAFGVARRAGGLELLPGGLLGQGTSAAAAAASRREQQVPQRGGTLK